MSDESRYSPSAPERDPTLAELAQSIARTVATAFIVAGALIALAIYSRPAPQRFSAFAAEDGRIIRVDARKGTVLACQSGDCYVVVKRGQRLVKSPERQALPSKAAETVPAKR
jgi:hypothetical protein